MQSKLFNRIDVRGPRKERFKDELAQLIALSQDQWKAMLDVLPKLSNTKTAVEQRPYVEALEKTTGIPSGRLNSLYNQVLFFLSALRDEDLADEGPRVWVDDLVAAEIVEPGQRDHFAQMLSLLKEQTLTPMEELSREARAQVGVLPTMTGMMTTVEMRAVMKQTYLAGTPVEEFEPQIVGLSPVVSIALILDSGINKYITFQAAIRDVDYVISELQAAKKVAAALGQKLKLQAD